jgi:long-chain acyl-CoA synthetase
MNDQYQDRGWVRHYPETLPPDIDVPAQTGLDMWLKAVEQKPQHPALYYFDQAFTYSQLDTRANSFALGLQELGIVKGDRVIIQLQNIPQYLITLYAVWKLGAIAVTLNPMYKTRELEYYINDSRAKIIVTMEDCFSEVRPLLGKTSIAQALTTSELDLYPPDQALPEALERSEKRNPKDALDLLNYLGRFEGRQPGPVDLSSSDAGYLTYTSGTTGLPKGAVNTHANVAFSARVYDLACNLNNEDVVVGVAPFFHVTGSIGGLAIAALKAIPVLAFYRFVPGEVLGLIEKWRATMMIAPLTVYVALLNHPHFKSRNITSLRTLLSGGAPVPQGFVDEFEAACGLYIHNWYGLTETTSPAIITPVGKRSPVDSASGALSIGVPVPNSRARVVHMKTGDALPPGEVGELIIKGPMVVPGYWGKLEETEKAIRDGWLYTGDVAKIDEDDWFYLIDRKKDLINVSGYKVWPRDVEDVLYQHPEVKEVCVIGVPDSYRGETVKAYVVLSQTSDQPPTIENLIEFCKTRMAAYKYPRQVEIVEELPKTLSGKILRRELRDRETVRYQD